MSRLSSATILLVDDSDDEREMYADFLRAAGYRPIEAGNPEDALRIATASPPDVVVADLMLPGSMSGLELTRHLRRDDRTKDVPVVLLTGMGRSQDREVAISAGAEAFLLKPRSPAALVDQIQRVLTVSRQLRLEAVQQRRRPSALTGKMKREN